MKKFFIPLLLILPLALTGQIPAFDAEVLDDAIEQHIYDQPEAYIRAYVLLRDQVNLTEMTQQFERLRASRHQRATRVVRSLQEKAAATQLPLLNKLRTASGVKTESIQPFWIVNMILVEATGNYLAELSRDPAVLRIEQEFKASLLEGEKATRPDFDFEPGRRERELTEMNVHKLWQMGYTGYGTSVFVVDTDIDFEHRALKTQFAYHNRPLEEVFTGEIPGQICFSHGTNVAGLIVGLDRPNRDTIGVAFNAKYMNGPVPFFDGEGNQCQLEGRTLNSLGNLQFALNPDGNYATSFDLPDVINNSYGTSVFNSNDCQNLSFRNAFQALDAAGVSVVFASGNEGPEESTLTLQASFNFDPLMPLTVGAVDDKKVIADFSSRGPSLCVDGPDNIKPEIVAPGVFVRTAKPFNNYEEVPGTSFSAPYVSGIILLLKEAFPNLAGRTIHQALISSARDLGPEGEDNVYGNGFVDAYAAFNWLVDQGYTPTPPLRSDNDAIVLDVQTKNLDCERRIRVFATVANNGTEPITEMDLELIQAEDGFSFGTVTWKGEILPGEIATFETDPVNAFAGDYTIQVAVRAVNGELDLRSLDNAMKADVSVSNIPVEPEVMVAGKEICRGGQSMLQARSDLGGTIRWYNAFEGGDVVAEGPVVLLENVQRDTTLYVSVASPDSLGLPRADVGPNTFLSQRAGLVFDAFANFTLKSVKVFAESAGPRIIQLRDARGNVQQRVAPISSAGQHQVELNFEVEPGEDYELLMSLGNGLAVTTNETGFPHIVEDIVRINRSTGTVATFYAYFYDWQIEYDYVCGRVGTNIIVDEQGTAPLVDFAIEEEVITLNEDGQAVARFTDLSAGLAAWTWSFGDGSESNAQSPVYVYDEPGIYTVTLYGTDAEGCSSMAVKTIEVQGTVTSATNEQRALDARIGIFPNPVRDRLSVALSFPQSEDVSYAILDLLGQVRQRGDLGRQREGVLTLDTSALPAGTYLIQFRVGDSRIGKKVVKY